MSPKTIVECLPSQRISLILRIIAIALMPASMLYTIITFVNYQTINMFSIFLFIVGLFIFLHIEYGVPGIVITDIGIKIKYPFTDRLYQWDKLVNVRSYGSYTYIYIKGLPLFNWLLGLGTLSIRPAILIDVFHSNYSETLNLLESRLHKRD